MKKLLVVIMAVVALSACQESKREYLSWHGLSLSLKASQFADSLIKRGFTIDTTQSTPLLSVFTSPKEHFVLALNHENDSITDVLEQYHASYNDSTANLWQTMHDQFEKELEVWPDMRHRVELHKEAVYETPKGTIVLTLLNTYTPTLTVRYSNSIIDK